MTVYSVGRPMHKNFQIDLIVILIGMTSVHVKIKLNIVDFFRKGS